MNSPKPRSKKTTPPPPWTILDSEKHELNMTTAKKIVDRLASERPLLRVMDGKLQRVFQDKEPKDLEVNWEELRRIGKIEKELSPICRNEILTAMTNFHQVVATDFPTENDQWETQQISRSKERIRMKQYLMFGDSLLAIYNGLKTIIEGLGDADLAVRLHVKCDAEMLLDLMEKFHFALDWLGMYAEFQIDPRPKRTPGNIRRMGLEKFVAEVVAIYHAADGPKKSFTYYHWGKDKTKQFKGPLIDFILALIKIIKDILPEHALPADEHLQNEVGEKMKELLEAET